jgi:hypothetical protein
MKQIDQNPNEFDINAVYMPQSIESNSFCKAKLCQRVEAYANMQALRALEDSSSAVARDTLGVEVDAKEAAAMRAAEEAKLLLSAASAVAEASGDSAGNMPVQTQWEEMHEVAKEQGGKELLNVQPSSLSLRRMEQLAPDEDSTEFDPAPMQPKVSTLRAPSPLDPVPLVPATSPAPSPAPYHRPCFSAPALPQPGLVSSGAASPEANDNHYAENNLTTVMLRNIACRYTQEDVASILEGLGFGGKFDCVYLPRSPTRSSNLGYAFVNFTSPDHVKECFRLVHNQFFGTRCTSKRCQVALAHVQGDCTAGVQRPRRKGLRKIHQAVPLYLTSGDDQVPLQGGGRATSGAVQW